LLLKKHTFHSGEPWINSAAEFAVISLADDCACSVMLLAAELKRFLEHDVSLIV
jgi:hypothetical protein